MNVLADESVDRQSVERLRREGHAVLYIAEMEPGITDDAVLAKANEQDALLVTADKDFGELVFRQDLINSGVVLLRLAGLSPETRAALLAEVLRDREAELLGAFTVISPGMVRIRRKS